jgi:hypothetical protein
MSLAAHAAMATLLQGDRLALGALRREAAATPLEAARLGLPTAAALHAERLSAAATAATLNSESLSASASASAASLHIGATVAATAPILGLRLLVAAAMTASRLGTRRHGDRQSGDASSKK